MLLYVSISKNDFNDDQIQLINNILINFKFSERNNKSFIKVRIFGLKKDRGEVYYGLDFAPQVENFSLNPNTSYDYRIGLPFGVRENSEKLKDAVLHICDYLERNV